MDAYVTEEQQVEAIKKWFNQYGNILSWAVIVILSVGLAIKYWLHHEKVIYAQASDNYAMLLLAMDNKDEATVKTQAEVLLKDYPKSVYATFAAFALAKEAVHDNKIDVAVQQLEWAMNHSKQADFSALARIRLMRLFISENKLSEALALFDEKKAYAYLPIMTELKGDLLLKQNDREGARKAYEAAFQMAAKEDMMGYLLKIKLEELGVDPSVLRDKETKAVKS